MRQVFVCTTEYGDHWAKTIARKQAQFQAMSEADRQRILSAPAEEHADGHRGLHCGQTLGGQIYERYQQRLREAGIADVIVSPNACVAQHAYGCVVMVYPEGLWYRIRSLDDAWRVLEEHVIGGRPVMDLLHRRLAPPTTRGVSPPAAPVMAGSPPSQRV